jgi:hypothetical protein
LRDVGIPQVQALLQRVHGALTRYSSRGEEQARQAKDQLFGIENSLKSFRGQLAGLRDDALMTKKREAEQRLRAAVAGDPKMQREYGDAWDAIAEARRTLPTYVREYQFLESSVGLSTRYLSIARALVRLAAENEKPNTERLPEFTEARRSSFELQLYSPAPVYSEMEQAQLSEWLAYMRDSLGPDHAIVKVALEGNTPEARAAELVAGTGLGDVAARKQLAVGGAAAIAASTDSMIKLASALDADARAARKRYEDNVTSVERAAYAKIAQAVFAVQRASAYPDGTGTLRLSFGAIRGYREDGKSVPPFTSFAGLYERASQHRSQPPYRPPARWLDRQRALNLQTPFDLVSTNDIVGGNSGSPVVNRNGELVGLIFDGNIQSLPSYFAYDDTVSRAVAVDSRAIVEALRKVYAADQLADELTGRRPPGSVPR